MIDLNHGALKKGDDVRAGPLSDRINQLVDAHFSAQNQRESEDAPRAYVGASGIGGDCERAIQLDYIHNKFGNLPEAPTPFPGRVVRIFRAGHVFEDMAADALRAAGFDMDIGYIDQAGVHRQHGFASLGGQFKGHFDGIIRGGPVFSEWPRLWECKALKNSGVNDVLNKGLEEAKPGYYAQTQVNMHMAGMHEPCLFTIINKDTAEWNHILIGYDRTKAVEMCDRAERIISATDRGELLPRPYAEPTHYKCRSFCDRWKKVCWKKLPD